MHLTRSQFDECINDFFHLLRNHLPGYLKGQCRHGLSTPPHIFVTIQNNGYQIRFTLLYDDFYTVPVIYFNVYDQSDIVPLQSLDCLQVKYGAQVETKISYVTLDMNPLSQMVSFYIHPCETLATLEEWTGLESPIQYLTVWFNLYGIGQIFPSHQIRPPT